VARIRYDRTFQKALAKISNDKTAQDDQHHPTDERKRACTRHIDAAQRNTQGKSTLVALYDECVLEKKGMAA
jgi:hypothetical protein